MRDPLAGPMSSWPGWLGPRSVERSADSMSYGPYVMAATVFDTTRKAA
ncbi:hypothetical protein BH24CHL9_BH24CHL9_06530 [soil metagenome]